MTVCDLIGLLMRPDVPAQGEIDLVFARRYGTHTEPAVEVKVLDGRVKLFGDMTDPDS